MSVVDMNRSGNESIGFISPSNCSSSEDISNVIYSDLRIGFLIGSLLSVIIISVAALIQTRYARRLYRAQTFRFGLNQLV